jgi:hypothetical protein
MKRAKILISTIVAIIFLTTQVIAVGAAPANQEITYITGTIVTDGITLETDFATVVVTLTNEEGTQTVRLSLDEAERLGLIEGDGMGNYAVDETKFGMDVEIDPATVIPDEADDTDGTTEEPQHPVGSAISDFFSELLGVDYETVMDYHDNGAGFGVIAQALWMTNALDGDSQTFAVIMDAKQTKDYSGITLPDGSTPQNWGQFRKAVMNDREKAKENLGAIMSGRSENAQNQDGQTELHNNGNAFGNSNNNALSNHGNNSNNNGSNDHSNNGNGNDKDKNKEKNKDKGNNKDK